MGKDYYRNHKGIKKAIIVETLEGEGTPNFPKELVKYIYDEQHNLLGILETVECRDNFNGN